MYYIYILRCRSGRLYTGITTDTERRFREHCGGGQGAKFTRSDPPEEMAAIWSCADRSLASKLEYRLKRLDRSRKLAVIEDNAVFEAILKDEADHYAREK